MDHPYQPPHAELVATQRVRAGYRVLFVTVAALLAGAATHAAYSFVHVPAVVIGLVFGGGFIISSRFVRRGVSSCMNQSEVVEQSRWVITVAFAYVAGFLCGILAVSTGRIAALLQFGGGS